jgi:hypothetical protein
MLLQLLSNKQEKNWFACIVYTNFTTRASEILCQQVSCAAVNSVLIGVPGVTVLSIHPQLPLHHLHAQ